MSIALDESGPAPLRGWYEHRESGRYTLARHWPPRFDVAASADFPPLRASRLAHQVRQDVWRAFQRLRGFSPVVQIDVRDTGIRVTAGGRAARPVPPGLETRIEALLDDPCLRARWIAHASKWAA
ncbi:hypothetical protein [Citreimonas salinaria]|uniref:hypothetical protein n=1 Tax=Citreimonas salinaria TaxID=321339 RepID=UPI000A633BE8|nr:hypothetical protein [Citreimonas salinaria]